MQQQIILNGVSLYVSHIQENSSRPTIVFLHDSLGCTLLWRDFPAVLGNHTGSNVLAYDRQGYGASAPFSDTKRDNSYLEKEADLLQELLQATGITDAILFGHSDGGSIALIAAAKYPERIKGVITVGAHIFVEEITLQGIRTAATRYRTTELKQRLEKYHGDKTDALFQAWTETWLGAEFRNWNIEHFLPQIICPVLIIQGEDDEYGSLQQVYRTVKQVSGPATELIIPHSGHSPHKEFKGMVLKEAAAFINSIFA